MQSDHEQIRELVGRWMAATKAGDIDAVSRLMTDDVVFLVAGRPPMRKRDFIAAARAGAMGDGPTFDGASEIEEIQVAGDWAWMRSRLTVVATMKEGSPPIELAGDVLTVLRKENGRWLLARDANLLTPVLRPADEPQAVVQRQFDAYNARELTRFAAESIELDHVIVPSRDRRAAAESLAAILGVPWAETGVGPFCPVFVNAGLTLDFDQCDAPLPLQHYCFRVSEREFDAILSRLKAKGIACRSTPLGPVDMQVNTAHGGRIVYWAEPDGHVWEALTVSYARQPLNA
jgi:uncharacterized protein (TIGR02246 family)